MNYTRAYEDGLKLYKPLYQDVWKLIDNIQARHSNGKLELPWRESEIKLVIEKLSFNSKTPSQPSCRQLKQQIDHIIKLLQETNLQENNSQQDSLTMDRLKDLVHKMWQTGFPDDYDYNPNESVFDYRSDPFQDLKSLKDFTLDLFHGCYVDGETDKESDDRTIANMEYFWYNFIRVAKPGMEDRYWKLLHDMAQRSSGARLDFEGIRTMVEVHRLGLTNDAQFYHMLEEYTDRGMKRLGEGKWTWTETEDDRDRLWEEYRYYSDCLHDGKKLTPYVECVGDLNCHQKIYLNDEEKNNLLSGLGVPLKYCENHQRFDEYGRCVRLKNMSPYLLVLPQVPVTLRILNVDNDSWLNKGYKLQDKMLSYVKKHNTIKQLYFREEQYQSNDKQHIHKTNVLYVTITNKNTLRDFCQEFKKDWHSEFGEIQIVDPNIMDISTNPPSVKV